MDVQALNSSILNLTNRTSSLELTLEAEKIHLVQNKTGTSNSNKNSEKVNFEKIDKDNVTSMSEDILTSSPSLYSSASTFVNQDRDGNTN